MGVTSEYSTRVSTRELRPYFYCPVRPLHANNIFPGGRANRPIFFFSFLFFLPLLETTTDPMQTRPMIYTSPGSACFSTAAVYWSSQKRFGGKLQTFLSRRVFRVQRFVTAAHRYGPSTGTYLFASRLVELPSSLYFSPSLPLCFSHEHRWQPLN